MHDCNDNLSHKGGFNGFRLIGWGFSGISGVKCPISEIWGYYGWYGSGWGWNGD